MLYFWTSAYRITWKPHGVGRRALFTPLQGQAICNIRLWFLRMRASLQSSIWEELLQIEGAAAPVCKGKVLMCLFYDFYTCCSFRGEHGAHVLCCNCKILQYIWFVFVVLLLFFCRERLTWKEMKSPTLLYLLTRQASHGGCAKPAAVSEYGGCTRSLHLAIQHLLTLLENVSINVPKLRKTAN